MIHDIYKSSIWLVLVWHTHDHRRKLTKFSPLMLLRLPSNTSFPAEMGIFVLSCKCDRYLNKSYHICALEVQILPLGQLASRFDFSWFIPKWIRDIRSIGFLLQSHATEEKNPFWNYGRHWVYVSKFKK